MISGYGGGPTLFEKEKAYTSVKASGWVICLFVSFVVISLLVAITWTLVKHSKTPSVIGQTHQIEHKQ